MEIMGSDSAPMRGARGRAYGHMDRWAGGHWWLSKCSQPLSSLGATESGKLGSDSVWGVCYMSACPFFWCRTSHPLELAFLAFFPLFLFNFHCLINDHRSPLFVTHDSEFSAPNNNNPFIIQ